MANLFRCGGGGIPRNILLNRKYGLNKEVTGELNKYLFGGGDAYHGLFFGCKNTEYADLCFIAINSTHVPITYFQKKIDLTNVNSIEFTVSHYSVGPITLSVGTTTNLGVKSVGANAKGTFSLNVSELSGEHYIGFLHGTSVTWGSVSEIILH